MVPRLLVQACEVAICCWAVVPRRAAGVYRGGARRERCRHRESGALFKAVCGRARALVAVADTNEYCAGQQTDN